MDNDVDKTHAHTCTLALLAIPEYISMVPMSYIIVNNFAAHQSVCYDVESDITEKQMLRSTCMVAYTRFNVFNKLLQTQII